MTAKERPILFSAPMVRAILAGTKTQTRRVVKPQPEHPQFDKRKMLALDDEGIELYLHGGPLLYRAIRSPYGKPGDRLWVRETWAYGIHALAAAREEDGPFVYAAHGTTQGRLCDRWRPSIHMPRWASRITLATIDVRVERLQDISAADAIAEGIVETRGGFGLPDGSHYHAVDPRICYWSLWDAINGHGSAEANPWVWVIEFQRINP